MNNINNNRVAVYVQEELGTFGLEWVFSWEYPGREHHLDHAFVRDLRLAQGTTFSSSADHLGAVLALEHYASQAFDITQ